MTRSPVDQSADHLRALALGTFRLHHLGLAKDLKIPRSPQNGPMTELETQAFNTVAGKGCFVAENLTLIWSSSATSWKAICRRRGVGQKLRYRGGYQPFFRRSDPFCWGKGLLQTYRDHWLCGCPGTLAVFLPQRVRSTFCSRVRK